MLTLATWYVTLFTVLFVFTCLLMMLVILIQKPKGGGLSGAFGGAGGSANAVFGAKTGDVLTWFTVGCFVAFLLLAMAMTWTIGPTPTAGGSTISTPAGTGAPSNTAPASNGAANGAGAKSPAAEVDNAADFPDGPAPKTGTTPTPAPAPSPAPAPTPDPATPKPEAPKTDDGK